MKGYVLLEDGTRLEGELCGSGPEQGTDSVTGEVVFNTAMTGYQEAMSDPSYSGQIITFTYPMIGNYGVAEAAMESDRIHARAAIMRDARNSTDAAAAEGGWLDWLREGGVMAITGVDTRALVRHIRDKGAMRGGVFAETVSEAQARERIAAEPAMTGYQEAMSDPSYAGQIITFTYPMIGNYGVAERAMESDRIHARAAIMREARNSTDAAAAEGGWLDWLRTNGVMAITGVDTRALVRHIRDKGAMRGGVFAETVSEALARERIAAEPPMTGADLARTVTLSEPLELPGSGPRIVALDTGIKRSIIEQFQARDTHLTLLPCTASADEVLARDPDLVFLACGPGDPAALDYIVGTVRELVGRKPVIGICLGHQLLCRAVGLDTFKLPFGHRGANHPVKDLDSGRIDITSQNHGFAVRPPDGGERVESDEPVRWETDFGAAELTHVNLYDRTVEGLRLRDVPGRTFQYHPEAGPGPHDARHLFDEFLRLAEEAG
ncbi:MAG TPA: glutamine-hydrolyzing carbamoyl-phosphate synthase small subunit [Solirubrobacterales bacterium]